MSTYIDETSFLKDTDNVTPHVVITNEHHHYAPKNIRDRIARAIVHVLARIFDFLFKSRYGNRAIVLETVAAVPGMVAGCLQHLKALRTMDDDRGWIKALLDEAENERMHLLVYSQLARPTFFERMLIIVVQGVFFNLFFLLYLISPKTAHRTVGYLEEEAIHSYEMYLRLIDDGTIENVEAPEIAKMYWLLPDDARLRDVVLATIKDEMIHRDVNHTFANDKVSTSFF